MTLANIRPRGIPDSDNYSDRGSTYISDIILAGSSHSSWLALSAVAVVVQRNKMYAAFFALIFAAAAFAAPVPYRPNYRYGKSQLQL